MRYNRRHGLFLQRFMERQIIKAVWFCRAENKVNNGLITQPVVFCLRANIFISFTIYISIRYAYQKGFGKCKVKKRAVIAVRDYRLETSKNSRKQAKNLRKWSNIMSEKKHSLRVGAVVNYWPCGHSYPKCGQILNLWSLPSMSNGHKFFFVISSVRF